jgi:hypothetical protein
MESNKLVSEKRLKQVLLVCGILSTIIYVLAIVLGAFKWDTYDSLSQTVSELIAINAPSSTIVIPLFILYSILVFAFGFGVWLSAGAQKTLKVIAVLIVTKEILGLIATLFAPMHLRGISTSQTDTFHAILTGIGVLLCMLPAIGFGAFSFGKGFRIYSIITIVIFLLFGTLAGMDGSKIAQNQPTPYAGVWERINIFTYFLWTIMLSIKLLKMNKSNSKPEVYDL